MGKTERGERVGRVREERRGKGERVYRERLGKWDLMSFSPV